MNALVNPIAFGLRGKTLIPIQWLGVNRGSVVESG